ncbi:hypothetical protein K1719_045281, partial [Acacia pycnantha]
MFSGDAVLDNFDGSPDGEDALLSSFSDRASVNGLIFGDGSVGSSSVSPANIESPVHSGTGTNEEFTESNKYSNNILTYISDILMDEEDDLESQPCMLKHCVALQAAEKSFYDVLTPSSSASPHHSGSYTSTDHSSEADWSSYLCPDPLTGTQECDSQPADGEIHTSTSSGGREKRSHEIDDITNEEEGRGSKISAVYREDSEQSEVFDELLVFLGGTGPGVAQESSSKNVNMNSKVANFDQRNANELLKQIRQHSSPFGDGIERLSHYFANGLEMRLAAGKPLTPLDFNGVTAADMLRACKLYITASPFQRITNFMSVRMIMKQVENGRSLHIIDFGINYGFQWPCLIHHISKRS